MKKSLILSLCLVAAASAGAQTSLVKDVERAMKSAPQNYATNIATLQPAFTNPESADDAYTWFVAGKGSFDFYDNQQGVQSIGQQVDQVAMANAVLNGFDYLINAIQRDSVPNDKGKIKTKYSKDIVKLINGHYIDFNNAGVYFWQGQDYNKAYDAWELYCTVPNNPILGENAPKAPADSILGEIRYNQALAAWQADRLEDALTAFDKALALGYNKKNLFDYAIGVAYGLHNTGRMAEYAAIAYPMYGKEDPRYIGYMINDKIANKQFDEAQTMLESYIQADPENPQLYYILGVLYDSQEKTGEALANYLKAVELDPSNAQAHLQIGRQYCNQAYVLDDQASQKPADQYNEIRLNQVNPLFKKAIGELEKAYELDEENMHDALLLLRNCYYNVNDEANLQRVDQLLGM